MFGFLIADRGLLTPEELERYKACYCGVCRSLKARHGQLSRLTLTYDMTFLAMLEASLYEPDETSGENNCPAHPFKKRAWVRSEAADYAADMNLMLAYLKCRDDWEDDVDPIAKFNAAVMKRSYLGICKKYPRQADSTEKALAELSAIEKSGAPSPDAAADCFGRLMGEIFVMREDRWSDTLRGMGAALGRFIYVLDAAVDLDRDRKLSRFNPFSALPDETDRLAYFEDILKMELGECVMHFDRLPLVQDAAILKNILCSGLWLEFNKKYVKGKDSDNGSGSVQSPRSATERKR